MRECLQGRTASFGALIDRYEKLLFNIALRMTGDYDDARDVTQSAFVKVYRKLDTFDPRYRFFSWIYRIVINEALNFTSKRKRLTALEPTQVWERPGPDEECSAEDEASRVRAAVMDLSPDYRQVILLRHYVNLSYRDMSEALGIPEKTVKSRLFTARRRLAERLAKEGVTGT